MSAPLPRAGLAAAAAVTLVASMLLAAPATADEPTLQVQVVPATEIFMGGGEDFSGVVEVFDAASDLSHPVAAVPFGYEGSPLAGSAVPIELAPGSYKIKATPTGYLPGWYQYTGGDPLAEEGVADLPWLFGARSDSSPATTTIVTVGPDGAADHPRFSILVHDAATSIAGVLGTWGTTGWNIGDNLVEDGIGYAELYPVGATEPVQTVEVTQGAAFVFRDVDLGEYEVRGITGTYPGAEAQWPHPGLTPDDLVDPLARWYPGVADRGDGLTVTIDAAHPHWDGASVSMDDDTAAIDGLGTAVIGGDLYEGGTLFVDAAGGGELSLPASLVIPITHEWFLDDVLVPGANGASFVLPPGSAGSVVTAAVVGTIGPGAIRTRDVAPATAAVGVSPLPLLTSAPVPTVSGDAVVGARLTSEPGTWGPGNVPKTFQWNRNGAPIAGATARTYVSVADDLGADVSVTVTGSKPGYLVTARTSERIGPIAGRAFANAPTPTVRGQARVGVELTVGSVAWRPAPVDLAYQWFRDGSAITGATAATYLLGADDVGATLTVGVVASKLGYTTQARASAPTTAVEPGRIVAPRPALLGTPKVGQTLSIDTSAWTPADVAIAYRWQRAGVDIAGATGPTYVLTPADAGKKVRLVVVVTKPGYTTVERTTAPTANVAP